MIEERGIKLDLSIEEEPTKESEVFYNQEMVLNRDISVSALQAYQKIKNKDLKVCDALSASGIRGLRYGKEVDGVEEVVVNDRKPKAVENTKKNIEQNAPIKSDFEVYNKDANVLLSENYREYDFIDLDPFGSPVPYLDSSARSIFREGLVGITATDLAPLAGSYVKTCGRRYASKPLKNGFQHEIGIRILIKTIFNSFARFNMAFEPLLSFYQRHYYRVFGKVWESKKGCNRRIKKKGFLSYCENCGYRRLDQEKNDQCPHCKSDLTYAGPLWIGQIQVQRFCRKSGGRSRTKRFIGSGELCRHYLERSKYKASIL